MTSEVYQISDIEDYELSDADSIGTDDYAFTVSDLEVGQGSDSSHLGEDGVQVSQSTHWRSLSKKCSDHQHRSIIAPNSQEIHSRPSGLSSFTFLSRECYACTCHHAEARFIERCKVLSYFQMEYFMEWEAIFCPIHNCMVPASKLADHLCHAHTEWRFPRKKQESQKMAKHIIYVCGLESTQSADDIIKMLPEELDEPLVAKNIFQSFKCSYCDPVSWHVKNTSNGPLDRYIREHMKQVHEKTSDLDFSDLQWTYRVSIYPQTSNHFFVLPKGSSLETINKSASFDQPVPISNIPTLPVPPAQFSSAFAKTQDWPIRLKWEFYASEIEAGKYVEQLKMLIRPPKIRKDESSANFLEKGLLHIQKFCIKYMKDSGLIAKTSVTQLGRVLVSE